jgi:ergothioneine biosynthesis protein EgtB
MKNLHGELQVLQEETIDIVNSVSENNYPQQFHPDLSPIGWHLGHCVYTETYWICEQCLGERSIDDSIKSLYVPELSNKQSRGAALPNKAKLLEWAKSTQSKNRSLLESAVLNKVNHQLLENNYLLYFLIQHYSQHIETMKLILTEMHLKNFDTNFTADNKLSPGKSTPDTETIDANIYNIGSEKIYAYDNEKPPHPIKLNEFNISKFPVSNSEYLQFINEGGYSEKEVWSLEGWNWLKKVQHKHPHHWCLQNKNIYYGINFKGPYQLEDNYPVHGLSYFEAQAFANWYGARLPHEYEWEVASIRNCLEQTTQVWEWCSNTFHPYDNFSAYPYEGYSVPYFDGKHYVLRGGSNITKNHIKRASFRNYYTADKRHIYAGIRLVFD